MSPDSRLARTTGSTEKGLGRAGLRILIVSFRFPPYNSVGGVSVGKTVKYLAALGHEVRVVTARDQQVPTTLPMDVDPRTVEATGWWNPMRLAEKAAGGKERVTATGFSAGRKYAGMLNRIGRAYRELMIPDKEIGWGWPAYRAARRMVEEWRPDVIYASAPPYTSLLVAGRLASRTGIPWVAGLRDLWSDNPYRRIRLARLDRALESRVLASAAGAVTTTEESESTIAARYDIPTITVLNGYDPDDLREPTGDFGGTDLRIVHTGILLHDQRDPTPLFQGMQALHAEGTKVVADFYGRDSVVAARAAHRAGVADLVTAHGPVSYTDSLQLQRNGDVLLLLQSNHPAERGICPAKVFEYAAARRPVLAIGPVDGVVARILKTYGMGRMVQGAEEIAGELRRLADMKALTGRLSDVASDPPAELSRKTQVEKLADFLYRTAKSTPVGIRAGEAPKPGGEVMRARRRAGSMLRVVHVIGQMPGHGTQRQLAGMLQYAHGKCWMATLAVLRPGDHLTQEIANAGIPVVEFSGRDDDPRRLVSLRHLLAGADVVHSSLWGANAYARVAVATRRRRPAVVVSERSVEEFRSPNRKRIDRALRALTDEYIANSSDVARFVSAAHGVSMNRVTVIRNGIDRSVFFPETKPRRRDGRAARLGTVGRLIPDKGLDVLLAAIPRILSKQPVVLTVVGEGPERSALEEMANGLPVEFTGYLRAPSEVASFLRSIDLLVMPSRWEGLPNAVLEALACGVPVVATDVPGMAEAVGDSAILVPSEQPAALADAVCRALGSPPAPTAPTTSFEAVAEAHLEVFERAFVRRVGARVP